MDSRSAKIPSQIRRHQRGLTPSKDALAEARELVAAFATPPGRLCVPLQGQMVDAPHLCARRS